MFKKLRITIIVATFISFLCQSCESFVEIESPTNKMVTETVFSNKETATAAVNGIYNELYNADFSSGYINSVTVVAGMSPDTFETTSSTDERYGPFQKNEISPGETPDATTNFRLWSSAYNIIYKCNSVIEGLYDNSNISVETIRLLEGQVRFVRAFTYFYLVNLYGDVPLILTTDYRINASIERQAKEKIWNQIATDLDAALILLEDQVTYKDNERTNANLYVVQALRARVYLYNKNWKLAEEISSKVINQTSLYQIMDDINKISLMNNKEAIWQITPLGGIGGGVYFTYTYEGYFFRGINSSQIKLSEEFIKSFSHNDKRLTNWIGYNEEKNFYYPYKYKDGNSWQNVSEYSVVLRLAEQYLIRAEARAQQGNLTEAIQDIDVIRRRAGVDLISNTNPTISQKDLIKAIMDERKKEFFSEWGHRWLDLKRTGTATKTLSSLKPKWEETDIYYPIPNEERAKNPKLTQNDGY